MFCRFGTSLCRMDGCFALCLWLTLASMSIWICTNWSESDQMRRLHHCQQLWNLVSVIAILASWILRRGFVTLEFLFTHLFQAYHCPACDVCVFRRDHHCSFAATCVGHFNHRYFVAAVVNLWLVMFVCMNWNWNMVFLALPKLGASEVWKLMMPHVALMGKCFWPGFFKI
jgi:hypothetical protein